MASKARDLSNFISVATVDASEIASNAVTADKIADVAVTHAKLHTDMNLSGKTLTFATNQISGNAIDGGVISNFTSTGIDDNSSATAVTILSSGNVGIGDTTPQALLDVGGGYGSNTTVATFAHATDAYIEIENMTSQNGAGIILTNAGTKKWTIQKDTSAHSLHIQDTSADVMTFLQGGNVGIGETVPVAKLHIQGSGTSGQVSSSLILENSSSGTAGLQITGAAGSSHLDFMYAGGPGTGTNTLTTGLAMTLEGANAGNVGIGTDSPTSKLHVDGTVTATAFAGSGAAITGVAKISNASTPPSVGAAGTMYYNTTGGALYISNGAAWVQSYKNPANGSSSGSAAEYGSDIIALGLGAGLYWLTGRVAANHAAQQVYVDADGWMLFYRHAGTGGAQNSTYYVNGDSLGEAAVGTLTSPTQGLTDAGSSTAAGSAGVARLATDFIRSLGGDSATNNVYRVTTSSVSSYITDAQWWSTSSAADGYGASTISCGSSYATRRATSGTPDSIRPMGSYPLGQGNVIPWYHGTGYSGGYNGADGWHISSTCWVREF